MIVRKLYREAGQRRFLPYTPSRDPRDAPSLTPTAPDRQSSQDDPLWVEEELDNDLQAD